MVFIALFKEAVYCNYNTSDDLPLVDLYRNRSAKMMVLLEASVNRGGGEWG